MVRAIVTITSDNVFATNDFRSSVGAQWTFLSDVGRKGQKDLDIQEYTDPHNDPMIPHTLVLKPERELREATREVRPDWDLSNPGLSANWDTGDR